MRVLVCGGRDFTNAAFICATLDRLHRERPFTAFMQGGARGVDSIAAAWARNQPGLQRFVCKADWEQYGQAAGPIRNARMLEWKPDLVVAFPGGRGTADMVRRAHAAGIETCEAREAENIIMRNFNLMAKQNRLTRLDDIADRLGALYQTVGRLTPKGPITDPQWIAVLDEILKLTEDVEKISGRSLPR